MRRRRVLIVHEPGLHAEGLKSLLETDSRLEVIGMSADFDQLGAILGEINPDVLLVEDDKFSLSLGDPPDSFHLDRVPLVIAVSGNENRMRVYRVQQQALTTLQELVEAMTTRTQDE